MKGWRLTDIYGRRKRTTESTPNDLEIGQEDDGDRLGLTFQNYTYNVSIKYFQTRMNVTVDIFL